MTDVGRQLARRLVPPVLLLLQRLGHDRVQIAAERAVNRAQPARVLLADDANGLRDSLVSEIVGQPPTQKLVEHHPQGVDVGPRVELLRVPRHLLGAHVGHGADELADVGPDRRHLDVGVRRPGHAEVEDLRLAVLVDQDVVRLEVPVNDALEVRVLHGVAHLDEEFQTLMGAEALGLRVVQQRPALDELHGEVGLRALPVVERARVVHLGDVGVPQTAQDLRLVLEATQRRARDEAATQDLQRHQPVRVILHRLVDRAHPARADDPAKLVAADRSARHVTVGDLLVVHDNGGGALLEQLPRVLLATNEIQHPRPETGITAASIDDERLPRVRLALQRVGEDRLDALPCDISHRRCPREPSRPHATRAALRSTHDEPSAARCRARWPSARP